MNRREFIKSLGAFAALAYLPAVTDRIIRAPAWAKEVEVFQAAEPLVAGHYTFSSFSPSGLWVSGFEALGGETLFEVPRTRHPHDRPRISNKGIVLTSEQMLPAGGISFNFCDEETRDALIRGNAVRPA